jgi:hypothetical protein
MFAYILMVVIVLPPTDAVRRAHPIHHFTVTSNAAYQDVPSCLQAINAVQQYIAAKVPVGSLLDVEGDCEQSVVVEARW